jgi:competence protein ComEA
MKPTSSQKTLVFTIASLLALVLVPTVFAHAETPLPVEPLVVDLNHATQAELDALPGIGPSKANAIIEYRTKRRFRTVEELVRVKGFGAKTVRRLRPLLVVGATAPEPPGATAPIPKPKVKKPATAVPAPCSCPCAPAGPS